MSSVASSDLLLSNTDVEGLLNKIKKLEQEAKEKDKKIEWLEREGQKKDKTIIGLLKLDDRGDGSGEEDCEGTGNDAPTGAK